jgi:hypothetical protein
MSVGKARGFAPGPHQRHRLWNPFVHGWEGDNIDPDDVDIIPLPAANGRVLRATPLAGVQGAEPPVLLTNTRTP